MHTYSGNKAEGKFIFQYIPPDFDVVLFEIIGCGNSEKGFLTYGIKEKFDLDAVLKAVDKEYAYQQYSLWGRSMGAVIAILFSAHFLSKVWDPKSNSPLKVLDEESFKLETVYERREGRVFRKVRKVKTKSGAKVSHQDLALYRKVSRMVLDSPFTSLFKMIQGRNRNLNGKCKRGFY